jgi:hypothetical protein
MLKRAGVLLFVTLGFAAAAGAQNLADVARAEEGRRKAIKAPAKVYTNDTLRGEDGGPAPSAPLAPGAAANPAPASSDAKPGPAPAAPDTATDSAKDEKAWRSRITTARNELKRSQAFYDALQSQINALYAEFVNMDDPVRRAAIEQKRLAAVAEQDQVKNEIAEKTKAVTAIEDEARRNNIPSGWLR